FPDTAYVYLFGVALFGALFVWMMIFVTHLYFRRQWEAENHPPLPVRLVGYPYTSLLGAGLILAIIITTWFVAGMRPALLAGVPWLVFLTVAYAGLGRWKARR